MSYAKSLPFAVRLVHTMQDVFVSQIVHQLSKTSVLPMEEVSTMFAYSNWKFVKQKQTIRITIMEVAEVNYIIIVAVFLVHSYLQGCVSYVKYHLKAVHSQLIMPLPRN